MNRITITKDITNLAEKYASDVTDKVKAIDGLTKLKTNIDNGSYKIDKTYSKNGKHFPHHKKKEDFDNYIQKIINDYQELLVEHPKFFPNTIKQFEDIMSFECLTVKVRYTVTKKVKTKSRNNNAVKEKTVRKRKQTSFFKLIVDAMGYAKIQSDIFPNIMLSGLNIKTCVYCNAQFAIAADKETALYQLDHVWPKSKYPFLSTSFFNLQPCCGSCNQRKSDIDFFFGTEGEYNLSIWKEPDNTNPDYFHFHLEDAGLAIYLTKQSKHDTDLLKIEYEYNGTNKHISDLHSKIEDQFHITDQYNKYKDIIEETVWRHQIYSTKYTNGLMKRFNVLFPDIKEQYIRLVKGRLTGKDTVYKRPLTQMMIDIDDQLDGVIN